MYLSVDGAGTTSSSSVIQVESVRAQLGGLRFCDGNRLDHPGRQRAGESSPTAWIQSASHSYFYSYAAEITSLVKATIDAAPAGRVNLSITEVGAIEGVIVAVVFDDASQVQDNTVSLMFGAQQSAGDDFFISLAAPLNLATPGLRAELGLGISYSYMDGGYAGQFSRVTVNGTLMTSCAGGQDDGVAANGALLTVGGLDDDATNSSGPCPSSLGTRADDEQYSLLPFVRTGDTQIAVHTVNPSGDDNIFFASIFLTVAGQVAVEEPPPAPSDVTPPVITPTVVGTRAATTGTPPT